MMKKNLLKLTLGLSLVPFVVASSVNAQESQDSSSEIEEILVSAALIPIVASRSANAITVIDSEQIKLRAAQSVSDLLRDVPGLAVSSYGALGSLTSIRARGSESNHLVVLIDGVEVNDPSQSDMLNWGTLSAADIERIEIIRGPQSSIRGSDAVAGVVNIITSEANQALSADVFTEYGSRATSKNGFSLGHKSGKFSVRFGASHLETDGINIQPSTGDDIDGYQNTGINLKAGYQYSDQLNLSLTSRKTNGMNEFDGFPEVQSSDFNRFHNKFTADYNSADGLWSHAVSLADSDFENDNFKQENSQTLANGSTSSNKQNYQYIGSRFWQAKDQRLSLALEREKEEYQQRGGWAFGADADKLVSRKTESVAVEYRFDPIESVTLAASARKDDNDFFGKSNTQRLEVVFQQSDTLRLRGAWGTAVKNPTFTELYGIYSGFQSNPNLKPEESESWELGLDTTLSDERIQLGATYFNAHLKDEIGSSCDANWTCTPINIEGISDRQGVELSSSFAVSDSLQVNAAYTYTDSEDPAGVEEQLRAKHIGSINVAWQVKSDTKVNINVQHNGSQTDYGFPNPVMLDAYTLVNLNANYSASDKMDVYLSLNNLFDEDYQQVNGYETLGFGANIGLRYKLQ
ncbi:MAG: TonB-dependent receptor plug domain-containing protein [Porticoccaceae bacterium]